MQDLPLTGSNGHSRHGRALSLDWLCRPCRAAGDPRVPGHPFRQLHRLCDPITYFCACPCDTGELDQGVS